MAIPHTSMSAFENAEGSVDWQAYRKAQVANGERCRRCDDLIIFAKGYPTSCRGCTDLQGGQEELRHNTLVRCPKCRHSWDPFESEDFQLLAEDGGDTTCVECDHTFNVETSIQYTFTSPAMLPQESEPEEDDEEDECTTTAADSTSPKTDNKSS